MTTEWVVREFNAQDSRIVADGFETEQEAVEWAEDALGFTPKTEPPVGDWSGAWVHSVYHDD